ncbi:metallophosphoesterase [Bacillus massiliigorillae]|uniref:metallophosphoesterase n=1 Tax=Bacillus massiliigorillae TaxID=1243664 RepID=UPI0003A66472|nr:metallophosphoesterase [Bacillus massiliigorillae]
MPIWLGIIGVLIVYNLLSLYVCRMVQKWLLPKPSKVFRIIYFSLVLLLANAFIIGTITSLDVVRAIGSYWFALLYILVFSVPLIHIVVAFLRLLKLSHQNVERWAGIVSIIIVVLVFSYGTFNAYSPVVRTYDVALSDNGEAKKQLNIVMVSDTHFGVLSNKNHAKRMVKEINALNPDLVLFPGDIVDDKIDSYSKQGIEKVIAKIKAKYGVYVSLGNHDKGDTAKLIKVLEDSKMKVLYDDTAVVANSITLIGRKDKTDRERLPLAALMKNVDHTKPIILLDHQPYDLDIAKAEGVDLFVAGHTHRGQVAPFQYVTQRIYENDWGYLKKGSLHSIVSSGYGFWGPPIRTNSRSEIVQIMLNY